MATGVISPAITFQGFTNNGAVNAGGSVYTYAAGTTTPIATYTDSTLGTPNTNPIKLNAIGQAAIWLTPGAAYKFIETDSLGNQCGYADQVQGPLTLAYLLSTLTNTLTPAYLGAIIYPVLGAETAVVNVWYPYGNVLRYGTNTTPGTTDMHAAFSNGIASAVALNVAFYVPGGTYFCGSQVYYTFSSASASLMICGDGADVTMVSFGSSNGFLITYAGPLNSVHFREMSILSGSSSTYYGIGIAQPNAYANAALSAQSDFENITFRGADGYVKTDYWNVAIQVNSVSNVAFINCEFFGAAVANGIGINLISSSTTPGVAYNVVECDFVALSVGIEYGNYIQGVNVSSSNFTSILTGIYCPTGALATDQLTVSGCQFQAAGTAAIYAQADIGNVLITDSLFIVGYETNFRGIYLSASSWFSITGNIFTPNNPSSPATGTIGIEISQIPEGVLTGVVITGTGGQFSCNASVLTVGELVTISGTFGGTGSITGYTNPTTYRIGATNGTTTFTLTQPLPANAVASSTGTAITTTAGTPSGLTFNFFSTTPGMISGNFFLSMLGEAIALDSTSSYVNVQSNCYIGNGINVNNGAQAGLNTLGGGSI